MAWTCSGISNESLVAALQRAKLVTTPAVAEAMRSVDRKWFVPSQYHASAYADQPLPIGYGATISAPHMHAIMLELLAPLILHASSSTSPFRVLDVGSGSGYLTAVLAELCSRNSNVQRWGVYGMEHVPELQVRAMKAMKKHFARWVEDGSVRVVQGDGRRPSAAVLGTTGEAKAQFNVIHVGAAASKVHPELVELLQLGGRMVIPVGEEGGTQQLLLVYKDEAGQVTYTNNGGVSFVPLTSLEYQVCSR